MLLMHNEWALGEQKILKAAIRRLRATLQVVVQVQLQGRSTRETAEAIGISLSAAKARLFHARRALRRSVSPKLRANRDLPPRYVSCRCHDHFQETTCRHSDDSENVPNFHLKWDVFVTPSIPVMAPAG